MQYSQAFENAINNLMQYEVGPFWKLTLEVQQGLINTAAQRKAVGYVNDHFDTGGETKFGIAANHNPNVNIKMLTWDQAKHIYFQNYWLAGKCDKLPNAIAILHFDCCVNHGVKRASIFLQQAIGVSADGQIGPITITRLLQLDPQTVCKQIKKQRDIFYESIVRNNPSQIKFLKGWLNRSQSVTSAALKY